MHVSSYSLFVEVLSNTQIYTLSLHDALPISYRPRRDHRHRDDERAKSWSRRTNGIARCGHRAEETSNWFQVDRKSTRLNSSHTVISYAVFCLKKKSPDKVHRIGVKHALSCTT